MQHRTDAKERTVVWNVIAACLNTAVTMWLALIYIATAIAHGAGGLETLCVFLGTGLFAAMAVLNLWMAIDTRIKVRMATIQRTMP